MTYSLDQAMKAQQALREAAALPEEKFPLPALIGMLSDEIEAVRGTGKTDEQIAKLINQAAGTSLSPTDISENYAAPEERGRPV